MVCLLSVVSTSKKNGPQKGGPTNKNIGRFDAWGDGGAKPGG
jgi:hypothetical protein